MPLPAPPPRARWFLLGALAGAVVGGCSGRTRYTPPTTPMPPNTILLSQMLQELSAKPGFTEAILAELDKGGKNGPALLTPRLLDTMRTMILGKDWEGLNRFPGWTMREINPTVRVVGHVVGKDDGAEALANPGQGATTSASIPNGPPTAVTTFIDLGPFDLRHPHTIDLDQPSTLPGFPQQASEQGTVTNLGDGVTRGDGPDPSLAPMHAESARLAFVLNRLSLNALEGTPQAVATIGGQRATTPEQLVRALTTTNHTVTVADARYFANFGHFHYNGQDVMMPFWVNSQIRDPRHQSPPPRPRQSHRIRVVHPRPKGQRSRRLLLRHRRQGRVPHHGRARTSPGSSTATPTPTPAPDAVEVTRLIPPHGPGLHAPAPQAPPHPLRRLLRPRRLPGCRRRHRKKMTGHATLFPNTADASLFDDPRDAEVNALIAAIPKDRSGRRPEPDRIFGSLPTTDLHAITIPGLAADLLAPKTAWQTGALRHTHGPRFWIARSLEALGVALAALIVYRLRRPSTRGDQPRTANP